MRTHPVRSLTRLSKLRSLQLVPNLVRCIMAFLHLWNRTCHILSFCVYECTVIPVHLPFVHQPISFFSMIDPYYAERAGLPCLFKLRRTIIFLFSAAGSLTHFFVTIIHVLSSQQLFIHSSPLMPLPLSLPGLPDDYTPQVRPIHQLNSPIITFCSQLNDVDFLVLWERYSCWTRIWGPIQS